MWEQLRALIAGKDVCIWGFGREGRSTLRALERAGGHKSLVIADQNPNLDAPYPVLPEPRGDLIFKAPGVPLAADEPGLPLTSQTEVFLSRYAAQTVGVTGTKGKSTAVTMIHHALQSAGRKSVLLGNIGVPAFDRADEIESDTVVVFEMSSHQLQFCRVSPHIAALLNVFPEHLDHYGTFERYAEAKRNIYAHQRPGDLFFRDLSSEQAARAVCGALGVTPEAFDAALKSYTPLPHRLEPVPSSDGLRWVDDSISTIPESAILALRTVPEVGTLLLGGMDRGVDYAPLCEYLRAHPVPNVVLMPDTGRRLYALLDPPPDGMTLHAARDLREAVDIAKKVTQPGQAALLSPAAASYGFFRDFEQRGERFKEYVNN